MEKLEVGQKWKTPSGNQFTVKDIEDGWVGFEDQRGQYNATPTNMFMNALKVTGAKLEGRDE